VKFHDFIIQNEYTQENGLPGRDYPWLKAVLFAEPHRSSQLVFRKPAEGHVYEWKILTGEGELEAILEGAQAEYIFKSTEDRSVVFTDYLASMDGSRNVYDRLLLPIKVRYVRRELRSLTATDRAALLDAMKVHWEVDQARGQELYGAAYRSAAELLKFHLRYAGAADCDHIHDGYGFLPQHAAMTLAFEQSLQAVNPRVALHYWDYVRDVEATLAERGGEADFTDFVNSELFSAEWFGATDRETHAIADGRWAGLAVPDASSLTAAERADMPVNAFGQLRAPWSSNPDPTVVRYATECGADPSKYYGMPTCAVVEALTAKAGFEEYMEYVSYDPHGPVHIQLGGAYNCAAAYDALLPLLGGDAAALDQLKALAFVFHKGAYRAGYLTCATADGTCYCPEEAALRGEGEARGTFFERVGLRGYRQYASEVLEALVGAVCNANLLEGDNLQASSSYAPEFWPLHGNVERMYQLKRLGPREFAGGDAALGWSQPSWVPSTCRGHYEDDPVLMGEAPLALASGAAAAPTNRELLALLSPLEDRGLPYVYDTVQWGYCAEVGYPDLVL